MIDWNKPEFVDLPDLRMALFTAGPKDSAYPPLILCHGWPEIAYSWRMVIAPLVAAGFRVIAPDLRGYGATGRALSDKGDAASVPLYDMAHLCGDMAHLCDAIGAEKAIFAGHDWGGIFMWQLPFYHRERVAGLIGVNTPFFPRGQQDPIETFRALFGEDFYIVQFQNYGKAEAALEADIPRGLRALYRGPDKSGKPQAPIGAEWENFALLKILESDEENWPGAPLLEGEEFDHYCAAFQKTGFGGGINYYRNFTRNWQTSADFEQKIDGIPSLMISAANDRILTPEMAEGMDKYVPDLERHVIANCGHWTQMEAPDELAQLMSDWLKRRFA